MVLEFLSFPLLYMYIILFHIYINNAWRYWREHTSYIQTHIKRDSSPPATSTCWEKIIGYSSLPQTPLWLLKLFLQAHAPWRHSAFLSAHTPPPTHDRPSTTRATAIDNIYSLKSCHDRFGLCYRMVNEIAKQYFVIAIGCYAIS